MDSRPEPLPTLPLEPPPPPKSALGPALLGLGCVTLAVGGGLVNLAAESPLIEGGRVVATVVGIVLALYAVIRRSDLAPVWGVAFAVSLVGYFGMPATWDSYRLFLGVLTALAGAGIVLVCVPRGVAAGIVSLFVLFHFTGIFVAVTSPPPQPWVVSQAWVRIYRPYNQFIYMNNAYQFYSPDPGPATQLWFCFSYESPEGGTAAPTNPDDFDERPAPKRVVQWVKLPHRPEDVKDPLGLSFYRRLAIAEQTSQFSPGLYLSRREMDDVNRRRQLAKEIRLHPELPENIQYRPPSEQIVRLLIPSYVRHIAGLYARKEMKLISIKMYRIVHRIVPMAQFVGAIDPSTGKKHTPVGTFDPTYYMPYFQGEYDADGVLLNPLDPMLFWNVPILTKPGIEIPPNQRKYTREEYYRYFDDFLALHAGGDHADFADDKDKNGTKVANATTEGGIR